MPRCFTDIWFCLRPEAMDLNLGMEQEVRFQNSKINPPGGGNETRISSLQCSLKADGNIESVLCSKPRCLWGLELCAQLFSCSKAALATGLSTSCCSISTRSGQDSFFSSPSLSKQVLVWRGYKLQLQQLWPFFICNEKRNKYVSNNCDLFVKQTKPPSYTHEMQFWRSHYNLRECNFHPSFVTANAYPSYGVAQDNFTLVLLKLETILYLHMLNNK